MQTLEPNRQEKFWQEVEEKHGIVLGYGMGQYASTTTNELISPALPKKRKKIWGVTYITEKGIFLYRFPHQNWLASMFNIEGQTECWIEVFFSSVEAWRKPKQASFLKNLFSVCDVRLIFATISQDVSDKEKEKQQTTYTMHSFTLDYQRQLLLSLTENFLSDKKIMQ